MGQLFVTVPAPGRHEHPDAVADGDRRLRHRSSTCSPTSSTACSTPGSGCPDGDPRPAHETTRRAGQPGRRRERRARPRRRRSPTTPSTPRSRSRSPGRRRARSCRSSAGGSSATSWRSSRWWSSSPSTSWPCSPRSIAPVRPHAGAHRRRPARRPQGPDGRALVRHRRARPRPAHTRALRRPGLADDRLLVALISTAIGTTVGALAGYLGGWVDQVLMFITDLSSIIPGLAVLMIAQKGLRRLRCGTIILDPLAALLDDDRPGRPRRVPLAEGEGVRRGGAGHRVLDAAHHLPAHAAEHASGRSS